MSVRSKGRRSKQESGNQTGNETAGDVEEVEETGFEYPISSNIVSNILAGKQIEERINANAASIAGIESMLPAEFPTTLPGIETALVDIDTRVSTIESLNIEEQINANANAISGIESMLPPDFPATLAGIETALVNHETRILTLENQQILTEPWLEQNLPNIFFTLPHGDTTRRSNLNGFLTKNWRDGKPYPIDNVLFFLMNETNELSNLKLNKTDFNNFLKEGVTPEFMDMVAGSLMDVDINGVKQDLSTALQDRPTLDDIRYKSTFGFGSTWAPMSQWLETVSLNYGNRLDFNACFRGTGNSMGGLTKSLQDDMTNISDKFEDIKTEINQTFAAMTDLYWNMKAKLDDDSVSRVSRIEEAINEIKSAFNPETDKITSRFGKLIGRFEECRTFFDSISSKAGTLKSCGETNLQWPE